MRILLHLACACAPACPAWGGGRLVAFFGDSMTPRPVQHGGGVELDNIQVVDPNRRSVLRVRADCGGRISAAKLGVVSAISAASTPHHRLVERPHLAAWSGLPV